VLPVRGIAVQTKAGLIDMGLHDAFAKDGSLIWTNDNNTAKAPSLNRKLNRIETLAGGIKPKVVFFFLNPELSPTVLDILTKILVLSLRRRKSQASSTSTEDSSRTKAYAY
jgi:hypothetical protein